MLPKTLTGLYNPREPLTNSRLICCELWMRVRLNWPSLLLIDYCIDTHLHIVDVSSTWRSVRSAISCLRNLVTLVWHVVLAYRMRASVEWCECDHHTCECRSFIMICCMCREQWCRFTLHSHINISHTQRSVRYTGITRTKVQRCYTVRQMLLLKNDGNPISLQERACNETT